jgi:hypothetical protein
VFDTKDQVCVLLACLLASVESCECQQCILVVMVRLQDLLPRVQDQWVHQDLVVTDGTLSKAWEAQLLVVLLVKPCSLDLEQC